MCILACASCVNAADADDALADSQIDFGEADILLYVVADDTPDTDSSTDSDAINVPDSSVINHHSHPGKKTHSHKEKKFTKESDDEHHGHKIHKRGARDDIKHHHKKSHHSDRPAPHNGAGEHVHDGDFEDENLIATDISPKELIKSVNSLRQADHVSKVTGQSEFSCCKHNCSEHSLGIDNLNAVIFRNINDDSAYSYEDYYVSFNTTACAGGIVNFKNHNSKNHDENHVLNINLDMNWDGVLIGDCGNPFCYSQEQEDHDAINIDCMFSQLDVKDYNMEYYIFTNPDIIVKKANANTLNRCPNLDAKTKYFDSPFLSGCIADNYVPFNTTFYKKSNFMLMKSNALTSVQSPVNLADESAITFLSIFG